MSVSPVPPPTGAPSSRRRHLPTIKDVAAQAHVAPSTVSRVLTDDPRITPETKERVRAVLAKVGYHPNAIARSLIRQQSQTIGLLLSRSTELAFRNPFFPAVIRGISSVLQVQHYGLLLSTATTPREEREEGLRMLRDRRVDGLILLASRRDDSFPDLLRSEGFPFVVVGRVPDTQTAWVNNDNVAAARAAVEHLVRLGHRRIAFLGGIPDLFVVTDRLEGYQQALATYGLEARPEWVAPTDFTELSGLAATRELLATTPRPTAIVCCDDLLATAAIQAAVEAGLRVPDDVAIVGFNDDPLARLVHPRLTTVRVPMVEMGEVAAHLLLAELGRLPNPYPARQVLLPVQLIVRESCGSWRRS